MVLGGPQAVEAEIGGEPRQPDLLVPHLRVRAVLPAVAGEHHHHADIHGMLLHSLSAGGPGMAFTAPALRQVSTGTAGALSQRQLPVAVCANGIAVLPKRGMAAAVAHDLAVLLALVVAADAGHPRVDLVEQQALATRLDVVGPLRHASGRGLDARDAAFPRMPDQTGHPVDVIFD